MERERESNFCEREDKRSQFPVLTISQEKQSQCFKVQVKIFSHTWTIAALLPPFNQCSCCKEEVVARNHVSIGGLLFGSSVFSSTQHNRFQWHRDMQGSVLTQLQYSACCISAYLLSFSYSLGCLSGLMLGGNQPQGTPRSREKHELRRLQQSSTHVLQKQ